jgi:predicted kinase
MKGVIVAMAGLPGVGKSTLAHALAAALDAAVLDKDRIRAGLFTPSLVDYSHEQDDFCVEIMYRTARWLLNHDPTRCVILDGRTFARSGQVAVLRQFAADIHTPLRIIECTCDDEIALARIDQDRAAGSHPAKNRDTALYRTIQADADAIDHPKLLVDTGGPLDVCVTTCLDYLTDGNNHLT